MNAPELIPLLKTVHIGMLILWTGPTFGAWLMLVGIYGIALPEQVRMQMQRVFFRLMWLEHLALAGLLLTGTALALSYGYTAAAPLWLHYKLILVLLVVLPLEAADVWLGHFRLPRVLARAVVDAQTQEAQRLLHLYHHRFTPLALAVLPPALLGIMWLAVAKPF